MTPISVVIITLNEEQNIERCLQSVLYIADDIVVLDSYSKDRTQEICCKYGARFFQGPFENYVNQKNKAVEFARYPHVFSIDADEVVSAELKSSILAVKNDFKMDGYIVNRLTNYCGKWIRHSDWYPDRKLRLWDTTKGRWDGILIHEQVAMQSGAQVQILKGDLQHYSFTSIEQHIQVLNNFTSIMAEEGLQKGKKIGLSKLIFNPLWKFVKSYVFRQGFLDGYYGFVTAVISAHATFIKYVKIKELQKKKS